MPLLALEPFMYPDNLFVDAAEPAAQDRWWVLHTRPRTEKALARRFLIRGASFFLPLYARQWNSRGRALCSHLPLFPGYVFLHGDGDARLAALETNLVARVLPADDQCQLHSDLRRVYDLITTGAPLTPEDRLEPGDPVRIVRGPLAGLQGKIVRCGKNLRFVVEVEFLRRAVSAEVESWMVEPAGPESAETVVPRLTPVAM
jgi:transcription antitermination factor NusG